MLGFYAADIRQNFAPDRASVLQNESSANAPNVRAIGALGSVRLIQLGETPVNLLHPDLTRINLYYGNNLVH
jgi:hypothetical protein